MKVVDVLEVVFVNGWKWKITLENMLWVKAYGNGNVYRDQSSKAFHQNTLVVFHHHHKSFWISSVGLTKSLDESLSVPQEM